MQPTIPTRRDEWTFEDVDALDVPDWWRYEIVDGTLVVSPSTGGDHELASAEIRIALQRDMPADIAVVGPMGVRIGRSYLVPDLVVAHRSRLRGARTLDPHDVLLAAEIVSPGSVTMDRVLKPAKYAAAGVAHYWRIETDPVGLTVGRLAGDVYVEAGTWQAGEVAELSEPFPVTVDLGRLLGE
ncbi:Endonuclease, Uma2 family (restriction endonuclease fold) [Jatrophihabitans endophyticus]|uniref:Endonuclease, Uma2 family (Restriction endonuclease fold) n=1 Tax=Jatrophihabitans endophyticus TaxID=1206085 RepID=A0A1M5GH27_9ACTN|nr:Uma2 family endonuclease [Jatrophihabitans endophyticus]SHG03045.1 Endonuclease, Uma2 family (restriction endonuclease fold) [Jatrophihabitans endophyticus]